MAELYRAHYTAKEEENMSDRRKEINKLQQDEVLARWDKVTRRICIKYGLKRKDM